MKFSGERTGKRLNPSMLSMNSINLSKYPEKNGILTQIIRMKINTAMINRF